MNQKADERLARLRRIAHKPDYRPSRDDMLFLLDKNKQLRAVVEADYMTAGSEADADLAYQTMDETLDAWKERERDE